MSSSPMRYHRLDRRTVARIVKFAAKGAMNDDLAACAGVHRTTFYGWNSDGRVEAERRFLGLDPDPELDLVVELYEGVRAAQNEIIGIAGATWVEAAKVDWKAAEALLTRRFRHWGKGADPDGAAEGAGTIDDVADLAEARLSENQARALAGAFRRFGENLLELARNESFDEAHRRMGTLARDALT